MLLTSKVSFDQTLLYDLVKATNIIIIYSSLRKRWGVFVNAVKKYAGMF